MANVQVHLLDGHQLTVDENDRLADSSVQSLNGVTAGTVTANQFIKADANKDVSGLRNLTVTGSFIIGSADMNETDLEKLDGITNGAQAANKAVVADANVNIGVVKATQLHIGTSGSETQVTATAAELNYLDIATLGTGAASKAIVLDASGDYTFPASATIVMPSGGDMTFAAGSTLDVAGTFEIANVAVTASAAELNYIDTTAGTPAASKALVADSAVGVGAFRETGRNLRKQAAAAAKTTAVTLTAAEIMAGLITANQGGSAAADYTLPLAADLETALIAVHPGLANDDSFDFSLINISTDAAEDITIVTNTGWTLVGEMTVESNDADRAQSSGTFRVRRTAADAYTIYRIA